MTPGKASLEMSASIGRSKEMALITSREYPAIMNSPRSIADHQPHMIYMKPSWIQKNSCASGYAAGLSQEAYLALAADVYPTQLTRGRRRPLWQPHKTHCEQPSNALIFRLNVLTEFSCRELPWAAFFFGLSAIECTKNLPKLSTPSDGTEAIALAYKRKIRPPREAYAFETHLCDASCGSLTIPIHLPCASSNLKLPPPTDSKSSRFLTYGISL